MTFRIDGSERLWFARVKLLYLVPIQLVVAIPLAIWCTGLKEYFEEIPSIVREVIDTWRG